MSEKTSYYRGYTIGQMRAYQTLGLEKTAVAVDELVSAISRNKDKFVRMDLRPGQTPQGHLPLSKGLRLMPAGVREYARNRPESPLAGRVSWPRGNVLTQTLTQAKAPRNAFPVSPEGHRAINGFVASHELRELSTPLDQVAVNGFGTHTSPRIVAQDLNVQRTLTGAGSEDAKRYIEALRSREYGQLDDLLEKYFGARAVQTYGSQVAGAPKLPKAMINTLSRRYAKDKAGRGF